MSRSYMMNDNQLFNVIYNCVNILYVRLFRNKVEIATKTYTHIHQYACHHI